FGDDEGMPSGGIGTALAEGHRGHGRHAGMGQRVDCLPFLIGTQHRFLQGGPVLEYFPPADAPVNLDEIALPVDLGTQGTARIECAEDLASQAFHLGDGTAAGRECLERFFQNWCHFSSRRITPAARSGMLYRSACPAYSSAFC